MRLVVSPGLTVAEGRAEEVVDAADLGARQEGVGAELGAAAVVVVVAVAAAAVAEDSPPVTTVKARPSSPRRPKRRLTRVVLGG